MREFWQLTWNMGSFEFSPAFRSLFLLFLVFLCYCSRVVLEPAGALAVAGMKKYVQDNEITGQTLVAITSGANMDFDRLRFVSERADSSEKTLAVTIPI